jgi:cytochrome c biogenesis protein CcdA
MHDQSTSIREFERIQVLLAEWNSLRAEIIARTTIGFQIVGIGFTGIGIVLLQNNIYIKTICLIVGITILSIGTWFTARDLFKMNRRAKELERNINSRCGETLIEWETRFSSLSTGWWGLSPPLTPRSDRTDQISN